MTWKAAIVFRATSKMSTTSQSNNEEADRESKTVVDPVTYLPIKVSVLGEGGG